MAGPRQPTELIMLNGRKHLTQQEIEDRKASEVIAMSDHIEPPDYLNEKLAKKFTKIAEELQRIDLISNLDTEALARFVVAEFQYQKVVKKAVTMGVTNKDYYDYILMQEKLFKMARQAASDLGLTISSRCKLVVPKAEPEKPENKFKKFAKG